MGHLLSFFLKNYNKKNILKKKKKEQIKFIIKVKYIQILYERMKKKLNKLF